MTARGNTTSFSPYEFTTGKLRISFSALFLPAIVFFLNAEYFLLLTAVAVAVHELGHYIALRLCGGTMTTITLWLGGMSMGYEGLGYAGEFITALAGPGASIALALGASLCGKVFGAEMLYHLSGLSLLLGAFNLLPAFPLDGGRALFSASAYFFGLEYADRLRAVLSAVLVCAASLAGGVLLIKTHNPTLLLAACWLGYSGVRSKN